MIWTSRWPTVPRGLVSFYSGIFILFSFCHGFFCSVNHQVFCSPRIVYNPRPFQPTT